MTLILEIIFWICLGLMLHSYVVFPIVIQIAAGFKRKSDYPADGYTPMVSILIAAYNEEEVIEEKITGIFETGYPIDRLEILIGSDCSTDKTNILVDQLVKQHPQHLRFFPFSIRQGKPSVINHLVNHASGDILVLSDANVLFDHETLPNLLLPFASPKVGLVDTQMINKGARAAGISIQEKAYISREVAIKYHESVLWGTMMGPFGGCYALRRLLYEPVPSNYLVDDFFLNMSVLAKGYLAVNNPKARVYEDVSNDIRIEYKRKVRIATGNFQNLKHFRKLLWPIWTGLGFSFLSHKALRWIGPFIFLLAFLTLIPLGILSNFYLYILLAYLAVLFIPILDIILKKMSIHISLFRFITHFCAMNWALLVGCYKYGKGVKSGIWQPTKRNQ